MRLVFTIHESHITNLLYLKSLEKYQQVICSGKPYTLFKVALNMALNIK